MPSVLWRCWLGGRKGIRPVKNWVVGCWHGYLSEARCRPIKLRCSLNIWPTQLMPLPLTVSCFSKIQIGFTFLVPAHPGSPGKRAVKRVCVCVCVLVPRVSADRSTATTQRRIIIATAWLVYISCRLSTTDRWRAQCTRGINWISARLPVAQGTGAARLPPSASCALSYYPHCFSRPDLALVQPVYAISEI